MNDEFYVLAGREAVLPPEPARCWPRISGPGSPASSAKLVYRHCWSPRVVAVGKPFQKQGVQ